jgi:hypothetical protein
MNAHNSHNLGAEIKFYSEDAIFVLSQGRGEVRGREAIARLLQFDVAAGSAVSIDKLGVRRENDEIVIDTGPATERSRVFAALGIPIMRSSPTNDAFRIQDGKLSFVRQPEFTEACGAVAGDAMRVFGGWLKSDRPDAYARLYHDDKLDIRAEIVNIWIADIRAWRSSTGWRPDRIALANCTEDQPVSPQAKKNGA